MENHDKKQIVITKEELDPSQSKSLLKEPPMFILRNMDKVTSKHHLKLKPVLQKIQTNSDFNLVRQYYEFIVRPKQNFVFGHLKKQTMRCSTGH